MTSTRFEIERIFDLPTRAGLIAAGRMLSGSVQAGMTLRDQATGATVRVIGLELIPPPADHPDRVAIILDRRDAPAVTEGRTLIGD